MMKEKIKSPCVGNRSLDEHDVCIGCYRHMDEITSWKNISEQEKQQVLSSCIERKTNKI